MKLDLVKHLKLSDVELKQTYLFHARCSTEDQIEIMGRHAKLFHQLRSNNVDELTLAELSFIAITKAIRSMMNDRNSIRRKNFGEMSLEEIEKLSEMKVRQFFDNHTDQESVRSKLIQKWPLVVSLRMAPTKYGHKPLSYRKIAKVLKKELNLEELAHSTVYEIWQELELEKDQINKGI